MNLENYTDELIAVKYREVLIEALKVYRRDLFSQPHLSRDSVGVSVLYSKLKGVDVILSSLQATEELFGLAIRPTGVKQYEEDIVYKKHFGCEVDDDRN